MMNLIKEFFKKYIKNSQYKKNILIMVGGRVVAQVIPILLTPLFTRIYSPEEFGIFSVYATIVSFVAMISNGRYCLSIILPKENEKAKNLVVLSSFFTFLVSVLMLIILLFFGRNFFVLLNVETINKYLPLLILNILFIGLYEALFYYELREKKFKILATNVIIQSTTLVVVRLITGYLGFTSFGLILSYMVGYLVAYIILLLKSDFSFSIKSFKNSSKELLFKYSNFPKFSLLSDGLSTMVSMSPNIFLNKVFGSISAGYFSVSDKVLGSPIWFITSSVGDVFKQEASEQYRNYGSCRTVFEKTSRALSLIGIVPFLIIFIVAPYVVPFLFGNEWTPVGDYIRIFSTMYFTSFVVNPVAYVVYIINKQKYAILFQSLKFSNIVIAFVIGAYYHNLTYGLLLWSILITITNIAIFFISYKLAIDSRYVRSDTKNKKQN